MKPATEQMIEENKTWYKTESPRRYYELGGEVIKESLGFLYRYNEDEPDNWELIIPTGLN